MINDNDKINQLADKLEVLLKRQNDFLAEMNKLRVEINQLKSTEQEQTAEKEKIERDQTVVAETYFEVKKDEITTIDKHNQQQTTQKLPKGKSDLEKFIGENLST